MALYEFQAPDGTMRTKWFPMAEAPKIGACVKVGGETCTRVVSLPHACVSPDLTFTSNSLPRNHPDAPRVNEKGQPMFTSNREVTEFCAKTQHTDPFGGYTHGEL